MIAETFFTVRNYNLPCIREIVHAEERRNYKGSSRDNTS